MSGIDKARELIRKYAAGQLEYAEFLDAISALDAEEIDLTAPERDDAVLQLGIRAQAAAERIRRL